MSITIKDIAQIAGVSHMTVSRALNNSSLVSEKTCKKILAIAKELNYTPNLNARSLVLNKSYNIGLFFTSLERGTASEFYHEISTKVNNSVKNQYNMIIRSVEDEINFDNITSRHFDGIILLSQSKDDDVFIKMMVEKNIPIVCLNRKVKMTPCVYCDDKKAADDCIEHMIEEGSKSIGVIQGTTHYTSNINRLRGVVNALSRHGMSLEDRNIKHGNYSHLGGYNAMCEFIKQGDVPDAVLAFNDDMAIGAMRALHENKIKIPTDVMIAGFDGSDTSHYTYPSLTSVRKPIISMSKAGAKMLLGMINSDINGMEKEFVSELIIGESTTI